MGNHGFACTVVNRPRSSGVANITVYSNAGRYSLRDISYAIQERAEPNTANGWFQIEADDYELFLKHHAMLRNDDQIKLSPQQAAAQLWDEFLERAGIAHA